MEPLFPWFGGKRDVTEIVWPRFGDCKRYIEPFFGGGAMLLGRPDGRSDRVEIVNDKDALVTNFWRSAKKWPAATTDFASDLYSENDLHARHKYIIDALPDLQTKVEADPFYCDTRIAGWWLQGICMWIGSGYARKADRKIPTISYSARAGFLCHVRDGTAQSVMHAVSERLRNVTVCSGDWQRVVSSESALGRGMAVFLDPPYADTANRYPDLYRVDSLRLAHDVREWAIAHGDNPRVKIALCGNVGEHTMPESWRAVYWRRKRSRLKEGSEVINEVIYFSPHCIDHTAAKQMSLKAG